MACLRHQALWKDHLRRKHKSTLNGLRRVLQKRNQDREEWQPQSTQVAPAHDDEVGDDGNRHHYFSPSRFYCVETICAPCGTVIAWTKFDKSESPTKILDWLEQVYPHPGLRPAYICIDKACQVFLLFYYLSLILMLTFRFYALQQFLVVGKSGKQQAVSLLTHIIISITKQLIGCVTSSAILPLLMVVHQILLVKE